MAPTDQLQALLAAHIVDVKPRSTSTYGEAYAQLGLSCPAELEALPPTAALGFFREVELASWQVLTPDELHAEAPPRPSNPELGMPVVHCYDNTYIVVAADGRARQWDAVGDVAFESWPSLVAALRSHLEG
jgi:hypothetical protein